MKSGRIWILRLMVLAFSLAVALTGVEFWLRSSRVEPVTTIAPVDDPEIRYEHIPNFASDHGGWVFRYNELGLRGGPVPPKSALTRILFVGDSITDGRPLEENTYPTIVERLLNGKGPAVEVLNGGVTGYNIDQVVASTRKRVAEVEPDIVIYGLCLNDILEAGAVDATGDLKKDASSPGLYHRIRHSEIVTRVGRFLQWQYIKRNKLPPVGDYGFYGRKVIRLYGPGDASMKFQLKLHELIRISADSGARLGVVLFPLATQYMGQDTHPQRTLIELLEYNGVPVLDLHPVLAAEGGALAFVPNDPVHPHDQGHHAVANAVAQWIARKWGSN